jgi:hypothetical protein
MKLHRFSERLVTTLLTLVAPFSAGARGGGSDGGGNLEEIDFKYRSTAIERLITTHPQQVQKILGVDGSKIVTAIQSTFSECSKGPFVELMKKENKLFWFDSKSNTIYLDCGNYFGAVTNQPESVVRGLIVHEYARKAEGESTDYRISRHSQELFEELAKADPNSRENMPKRFAEIFNIGLSVLDYSRDVDRELIALAHDLGKNRAFCIQKERAIIGFYWANFDDPRCAIYRRSTHLNNKGMLSQIHPDGDDHGRAEYVPSLDYYVYRDQRATKIKNQYAVELEKVRAQADSKLLEITRDRSRTPLERSVAVAVRAVVRQKGAPSSILLCAGEHNIGFQFVERSCSESDYEDTMAFLAFYISDWMFETGGDLTTYREFELALQVNGLSKRVDYAISLASRAMAAAANSKEGVSRADKRWTIASSAFWGGVLTYLAWPTLVR